LGERRLRERTPLGRVIHITSGGAAVVGAVLGGLALAVWTDASLVGWLVGTISSAVLGAFFGFLLASFLEMTIRAWWQASEGQEGEKGRPGD
jgi:tetrahydromethanopterin S-methyltransferase subunit C